MRNLDKFRKDLDKLIEKGIRLQVGMLQELKLFDTAQNKEDALKYELLNFKFFYEEWYTESLTIIQQLSPNRLIDFIKLYKDDKRKEVDFLTYTISDHLIGLVTRRGGAIKCDGSAALPKFQQQLTILSSLRQRFESTLFDIKQLVQADIFDTEVETSKELLKKGFYRPSGVLCGVIIEKHLNQVCENHKIVISKKHPTISDFNDILKNSEVYDVITWRFIQRLGDIRNLCGHNKEREPTKEEVTELVDGTSKIIKTIY